MLVPIKVKSGDSAFLAEMHTVSSNSFDKTRHICLYDTKGDLVKELTYGAFLKMLFTGQLKQV